MNNAWPLRVAASMVLCLLSITPVLGQQMNAKDSPCSEAVATSDSVQCFSKARDSSEMKLTAVYDDLVKKLERRDAESLANVQRLWVEYRDANCSAERDLYEGGSAAPVA
jgi:uncharacterized protein YecT (DUF1311 family)